MASNRSVTSFALSPDQTRVVYLADAVTNGVLELFAVPLDGSEPAKRLNGPLPVGGNVASDFFLLPGGRTLYRADQETNDVLELFVALAHKILPK